MRVCRIQDDFDFDAWKDIALQSPEDFEQRRREEINRLIFESSQELQLMLRQLQFRVDAERVRSRTALKSCLRISAMMWDSFAEMHARLEIAAHGSYAARKHALPPPPASATIIPFTRRPLT